MTKVKSVADRIDPRCLLPAPTTCIYCKSPVEYTSHAKIYGGREYSDWPYIYLCTNPCCQASIGVHEGTQHPLGTLADRETKEARKQAHAAFDGIWKMKYMKRTEAYRWLAGKLDIEPWRCHIGWFDISYCKAVIKFANEWHANRKPKQPERALNSPTLKRSSKRL